MLDKNGEEVIVIPPEDTSSLAFLAKSKNDDEYYESYRNLPDTV